MAAHRMLPAYTDYENRLDYKLAFHCAPVIAGLKPANLVSIRKTAWSGMKNQLRGCARPLGQRTIYFYRLAECNRRILLLVYNREQLYQHLSHPENRSILLKYGYQADRMTIGGMLARLSQRVREDGEYPHEIGVFLGYPSRDVRGFIDNSGKDFRLCGYWKVYDNPEEAQVIFSVYDRVREFFCTRVRNGEKIHTIQYGGTT